MAGRKLSLKKRIIVAVAAIALVCVCSYYVRRYLSVRPSFDEAAWSDATRILADEVGTEAVAKGSFSIPRIPVGAPYEGLLLDVWGSPDEKLVLWSFVGISPRGGYIVVFADTNPRSARDDVVSVLLPREEAVRIWKTIRYLWWVRCSRNTLVAANGVDDRTQTNIASWTWPKPDGPLRFEIASPSNCSDLESRLAWGLTSRFMQGAYSEHGSESRRSFEHAIRLLLPDLRRLAKGNSRDCYLASSILWHVVNRFRDRSALATLKLIEKRRQYALRPPSAIVRWLRRFPLMERILPSRGSPYSLPDVRAYTYVLERATGDRAESLSKFLMSFATGPDPMRDADSLRRHDVFTAALEYLKQADPTRARQVLLNIISSATQDSPHPYWLTTAKMCLLDRARSDRDLEVARVLARDKEPTVSLCAKCLVFALTAEGPLPDDLASAFAASRALQQWTAINFLSSLAHGGDETRISAFLRSLYSRKMPIEARGRILLTLASMTDAESTAFTLDKLSTPPDSAALFGTVWLRGTSYGGHVLSLLAQPVCDPRFTDAVVNVLSDQVSSAAAINVPRCDPYTLCGIPAYTLMFLDESALPVLDSLSVRPPNSPMWTGVQPWKGNRLQASIERAAALIRLRHAGDLVAAVQSLPVGPSAQGTGRLLCDRCDEKALKALLADPKSAPIWAFAADALIYTNDCRFEKTWLTRHPENADTVAH